MSTGRKIFATAQIVNGKIVIDLGDTANYMTVKGSDALDILAGRIYRQGHAWSDFSTEGISENTAYVFDFQGESA